MRRSEWIHRFCLTMGDELYARGLEIARVEQAADQIATCWPFDPEPEPAAATPPHPFARPPRVQELIGMYAEIGNLFAAIDRAGSSSKNEPAFMATEDWKRIVAARDAFRGPGNL